MELIDATIEDLIANLDFIREKIPEKAALTPRDVEERLEGRTYGIKMAREASGEVMGIVVWYEEDCGLYLWLGAMREPGIGLGTEMLVRIRSETHYKVWTAKVNARNAAARQHLRKCGFKEYSEEDEVLLMKAMF